MVANKIQEHIEISRLYNVVHPGMISREECFCHHASYEQVKEENIWSLIWMLKWVKCHIWLAFGKTQHLFLIIYKP